MDAYKEFFGHLLMTEDAFFGVKHCNQIQKENLCFLTQSSIILVN